MGGREGQNACRAREMKASLKREDIAMHDKH